MKCSTWGGDHTLVVSLDSVFSELSGWIRWQNVVVWTTLVLLLSVISTVTGVLIDITIHLPSYVGSSLFAVGTESQTLSLTANEGM